MTRQNISGNSPYEPIIGFSRAVRAGNAIYISGTGPVGADDQDAETQTRHIFKIAAEVLERAGSSLSDVVRVHGEIFRDVRPAATMIVVAQLLNPKWRVEIELDAVIRSAEVSASAEGQ